MLPVGHFLVPAEEIKISVIPYLYNPEAPRQRTDTDPTLYAESGEWVKTPEFVEHYKTGEPEKENDIIVGYFERGEELAFKFKIREPIHQTKKFQDLRKNKRGSVCATAKKGTLIAIARRLGIKITEVNIKNICDSIKLELMKRELNSRRKHRHGDILVRWFYFHFE